jgi:hypothetical protein
MGILELLLSVKFAEGLTTIVEFIVELVVKFEFAV